MTKLQSHLDIKILQKIIFKQNNFILQLNDSKSQNKSIVNSIRRKRTIYIKKNNFLPNIEPYYLYKAFFLENKKSLYSFITLSKLTNLIYDFIFIKCNCFIFLQYSAKFITFSTFKTFHLLNIFLLKDYFFFKQVLFKQLNNDILLP